MKDKSTGFHFPPPYVLIALGLLGDEFRSMVCRSVDMKILSDHPRARARLFFHHLQPTALLVPRLVAISVGEDDFRR